jgi:hypothetical protein
MGLKRTQPTHMCSSEDVQFIRSHRLTPLRVVLQRDCLQNTDTQLKSLESNCNSGISKPPNLLHRPLRKLPNGCPQTIVNAVLSGSDQLDEVFKITRNLSTPADFVSAEDLTSR